MAVGSATYYSTKGSQGGVHHVYTDCPEGEKIDHRDKEDGSNNWPLCETCQSMRS